MKHKTIKVLYERKFLTRGVMIGVHDFKNLTLTSFPTTFEPLALLELITVELLHIDDLIVDFFSFSVNFI